MDSNRVEKKMDRLLIENERNTENFLSVTDFMSKYELLLPFESNQDFDEFDEKLKHELLYREEFVSSFKIP